MIKITDKNLREIIESGEALVIDFLADWCGPCKMISPIVDELAEKYDGKVAIGKVNIEDEECQGMIAEFGIRNIPTLLFFKNGVLVDKSVGAVTKGVLDEKIGSL